MLRDPVEKVDIMQGQMCYVSKEMEGLRKNQNDMLKIDKKKNSSRNKECF